MLASLRLVLFVGAIAGGGAVNMDDKEGLNCGGLMSYLDTRSDTLRRREASSDGPEFLDGGGANIVDDSAVKECNGASGEIVGFSVGNRGGDGFLEDEAEGWDRG